METPSSILVIDDEPIVCESCNRILLQEDFKVDTNTNPISGYNQAIANNYDLIILDLVMEDLDGLDLLSKLRKKKPNVPVIIITGYPTWESKRKSHNLGVLYYILKPFKPIEILEPIKRILKHYIPSSGKSETLIDHEQIVTIPKWEYAEKHCRFFKSGWLQMGLDGSVRAGGVFPGFSDKTIESIKLPDIEDTIYRGLPLAKVTLKDNKEIIIPSALSGKIIELNNNLTGNPDLLENIEYGKDWIARIIPNNLETELENSEIKRIGVFSKKGRIKDTCFKQLSELGYKPEYINSIEAFREFRTKVVVIDAEIFGFTGTKLIEIAQESTVSSFLPKNVKRIKVTNRFGKKVTLLSFDNLLYHNKGIGFLLIKSLLDKSYPVELNYTRSLISFSNQQAVQKINNEKEESDKIIILHSNDMDKLPGSIRKEVKSFSTSTNADNSLITITVQPAEPDDNTTNFDLNTNMALAEIIEKDMISK